MPQFAADDLPRLFVLLPLRKCQCFAERPARYGRFPAGQRFVACTQTKAAGEYAP